jgi:thiol:disulfide interchange protein
MKFNLNMKRSRLWLACLGLLFAVSALAQLPRRSPFQVDASLRVRDGEPVLRVQFGVPADHVLYSERLRFESGDGNQITPLRIPAPLVSRDKATGKEKRMYDRSFAADLKVTSPALTNLVVKFQGCSNAACYFPEKRTFNVTEEGVFAEAVAPVAPPVNVAESPDAPSEDWMSEIKRFTVVARETGYIKSSAFVSFLNKAQMGGIQTEEDPLARYKKLGLAATLFLIVLGGAGLNLTPCVLPLIPINLAIIGAGAQARSRRQGFWHGATYGAGMAVVYGILGLVVVLTGSKFGTLNSSVWFNVIIAAIFVVLALGMFDLVNIDFSRFGNRLGRREADVSKPAKSRSLVAFTLGAVAALLAGACVAPVVISVLLLATHLYGKGIIAGLLLPFLLGVGMALPWPFAGASLTFLPKPGRWMVWVKYSFGVLILLFSAYYGHLAYNIHRTQSQTSALGAAPGSGGAALTGANQSLVQALAQARTQGKPVLIDFQASWCKNCAAMEETVFTQAEVQKRLKDFVVVKYQAERPNESPAREVLDHLGVIGLPTFVVLAPTD